MLWNLSLKNLRDWIFRLESLHKYFKIQKYPESEVFLNLSISDRGSFTSRRLFPADPSVVSLSLRLLPKINAVVSLHPHVLTHHIPPEPGECDSRYSVDSTKHSTSQIPGNSSDQPEGSPSACMKKTKVIIGYPHHACPSTERWWQR